MGERGVRIDLNARSWVFESTCEGYLGQFEVSIRLGFGVRRTSR